MSQENVEVFKRAVDAYNRQDLDAFLEALDPEVEWRPLTNVSFGGGRSMYRGHEGARRFFEEMDETLADVWVETGEIRDLGERLVATGRLRGRGKTSGAETETRIGWVADFRDGRVLRLTDYLDPAAALEAAGEDD